ncbi:FkbM family methyltransferase [Candidatus Bathyarchaeota archaeon]|nr:FkbM family methyltransferase [Candidatus Bathyarchaeota archaeon]
MSGRKGSSQRISKKLIDAWDIDKRLKCVVSEMRLFCRAPTSFLTLFIVPKIVSLSEKLHVPLPPRSFVGHTPDGLKFLYNFDPGISTSIRDIYMKREYFLLGDFVPKRGSVVMDCGAHIGLYTLISARLCEGIGKVISIEPLPENFLALQRNISLNRVTNVLPMNFALSDFIGSTEFFVPESRACSTSFLRHLELQEVRNYRRMTVRTMTLDKLVALCGVKHVDILKLDVEGAEMAVIRGGSNSLRHKLIKKMIVEVHKTVNHPEKVKKYLVNEGYVVDGYFDINEIKGMLYVSAS